MYRADRLVTNSVESLINSVRLIDSDKCTRPQFVDVARISGAFHVPKPVLRRARRHNTEVVNYITILISTDRCAAGSQI